MQKEQFSTLSVFDRMVKDDNQGIQLSTTITDVKQCPQGYKITFGVMNNIGKDANIQLNGLPGEYAIICLAVNKKEIDKTRHIMLQEYYQEQQNKKDQ